LAAGSCRFEDALRPREETPVKAKLLIYILIAAALLQVHASAAEIILVGQDRRAAASAFSALGEVFDQEQFSDVAPDKGPFETALDAAALIEGAAATASATQASEIAGSYVRADGTITAAAEVSVEGATSYGAGQSNVAVRFTITEPTFFSLTGFIEGEGNATMTVQLSRPYDTVAWYSVTDERIDIDQEGMLEADTYDINITCSAVGAAFDPGNQRGAGRYDTILLLGESASVAELPLSSVQAFPNPFGMSTRLMLPEGVRDLRILDAQGRLVRDLAATSSSVLFDGRDGSGVPLARGVYWVKPVGTTERPAVKLVRVD
jgi:hypothetical protein